MISRYSLGLNPDATKPDADQTARAASLKPRQEVRARPRCSDAFKDAGDTTEDGDSQEESLRNCKFFFSFEQSMVLTSDVRLSNNG